MRRFRRRTSMLNTLQLGRIGRRSASSYILDETSVIQGGFAQIYGATQGSKRVAVKVYTTDCVDRSHEEQENAIENDDDQDSSESRSQVEYQNIENVNLVSPSNGHQRKQSRFGRKSGRNSNRNSASSSRRSSRKKSRNSSIISRAWRRSRRRSKALNVRVSTGSGRKQVQVVQVIEELRALARLQNSPHVVRLQEAFQLEDDLSKVWIVMEYLYGSLDEIMGRVVQHVEDEQSPAPMVSRDEEERLTPMDIQDVAAVTKQVLLALEFVHHKGVAHLDIKPGNIMFSDNGRVKLCDFGSALLVHETTEHTEIPQSTAAYMAPEVIARHQAFGRSADIFSLGVVVYEMIAAALPWKPTEFAAAYGDAEKRAFDDGDVVYRDHILLNMRARMEELEARQEDTVFVTDFLMKTIVPLYSEEDIDDITRDSQLRRQSAQQLMTTDLIAMAPPNGKQSQSAILGVVSKYQHMHLGADTHVQVLPIEL